MFRKLAGEVDGSLLKKLLVALLLTSLFFIYYLGETANAYSGGLLQGSPGYNSRNAAWEGSATDGNTGTYSQFFYSGSYMEWTLTAPRSIIKWQYDKDAQSRNIIIFYNEARTVLYQSANFTARTGSLTFASIPNVKYVRMQSVDTNTNRTLLNEFDVFPDTTPPPVPTGLKATPGPGKVTLTWNASGSNTAGYNVYIDGVKVTTTPITPTTYTATVADNVSHTIQVTAYGSNGVESSKSAAVTSYWDNTTPAKPTGLTATSSSGQVTARWVAIDPDPNFLGYLVYLDGVKKTTTPITGTAYTMPMQNDVTHDVEVSSVGKNGNESEKASASAYWDATPPAKPTGVMIAAGTKKGYISWNKNADDATGYNVYLDGKKLTTTPITALTYTYTGLNDEQMYTAEVTAVDANGNESAKAGGVFTTIPPDVTPPSKPTGLKASGGNKEAFIEWKKNPEADVLGYLIYVDGVQKTAEPITGTYSYVIPGLANGSTYKIQIRAVDTSGNLSPLSDVANAVLNNRVPDRPSGLSVVPADRQVTLKWSTTNGQPVTHYDVYRNGVKVATVTDGQYIDKTTQNGVTYQYKIFAVNDEGESEPTIGNALYAPPPPPPPPGSLQDVVQHSQWGFGGGDLWKAVTTIARTLGPFILLSILILFSPRIIRAIRYSIAKRRGV